MGWSDSHSVNGERCDRPTSVRQDFPGNTSPETHLRSTSQDNSRPCQLIPQPRMGKKPVRNNKRENLNPQSLEVSIGAQPVVWWVPIWGAGVSTRYLNCSDNMIWRHLTGNTRCSLHNTGGAQGSIRWVLLASPLCKAQGSNKTTWQSVRKQFTRESTDVAWKTDQLWLSRSGMEVSATWIITFLTL